MKKNQYGHKNLTLRPSVAVGEDEITTPTTQVSAVKGVHYQQIALLIKQSLSTSVVEPCLSPLLWSESFGLRLDG